VRTRPCQVRHRGLAAHAECGSARLGGGGGRLASIRRRHGHVVPHVPHLKLRRSHRDLAPVQGSRERIARVIASWPSCVRGETWTGLPAPHIGTSSLRLWFGLRGPVTSVVMTFNGFFY